MESINTARRTEDIALDLLKFIAAQAHVGNKTSGSTGFGVTSSARSPASSNSTLAAAKQSKRSSAPLPSTPRRRHRSRSLRTQPPPRLS
jgi:hypothetical protein